jgi:hypothetical protein
MIFKGLQNSGTEKSKTDNFGIGGVNLGYEKIRMDQNEQQ